ncbi:hypothetical protein ACVW0P_003927 [Mucilaginibacter sp. UYNi724]
MTFDHIKTILGIILGLSIAHLIKGIIKFVQHPKLAKPYWLHLSWCVYVLLLIMHFWWWESQLRLINHWTFTEYFFLFIYISVYYFLCSLLLPENMEDYTGYYNYFYSRKKWIFGTLGLSFILDFIDTYIKGKAYYSHHYGWEYPARNLSHLLLCIIAVNTSNKKFHAVLVVVFLVYELSFIYRLF